MIKSSAWKYVLEKIMHINLYMNTMNIFESYGTKSMDKITIFFAGDAMLIPILDLFSCMRR